ncbi:MAG TPA: sirohydrochlorin cobaltochelatase [Desulfopila sp.]|nr:sirohydrochlorin cobaltochelatase [Desulfopila sp.]
MRVLRLCIVFAVLIGVCWTPALASHHGKTTQQKIGILLVAFGSSQKSAQVSFDNIDRKVKAAYPQTPIRWAYTSHIIRKKLASQGKRLDSPEMALARMQDEGFTHVAVQSLHTIAGAEYHNLRTVVDAFDTMGVFQSIILGYPLLATQDDMEKTVNAILSVIPRERETDEAVILIGHGTHHPANAFYAALMLQLQLEDSNIYIGTVTGYPELDTILGLLKKNAVKKAYLMPFMSVAGDHAKNDMAGAEENSWKSVLSKNGIECQLVMKGTAEFDQFVDIWLEHLAAVLSHF